MQAVVEIQILVDFINAFTESDYRRALWLRAGVVFRVGLMLPSAISLHYQCNLPSIKTHLSLVDKMQTIHISSDCFKNAKHVSRSQ